MADVTDSSIGNLLKTYGWVLQLAVAAFTIGGAWWAVGYRLDSLHEKDTQIDRRLDARDDYITSIDRRLYDTENKAGRLSEKVDGLDRTVERNFQRNASDLKSNSSQLDEILGYVRPRR